MVATAVTFVAISDVTDRGVVEEINQVALRQEAENLKDVLLGTPGLAGTGEPWDEDGNGTADGIRRPGLLAPDGSGLQLNKLHNLRSAPFKQNVTDGLLNYEETATALGLTDKNLDFHVRSQPNLRSLDEVLQNPNLKENNLRVTYIGNVTEIFQPPSVMNTVRVCVLFVDAGGNIYRGPSGSTTLHPDTFGSPLPVGPVTFNLPHAADAGVYTEGDASCQELQLPDGEYAYGQADTLPGHDGPFYNDQHTGTTFNLNEFYRYSDELFDANPDNDHLRNTDSDGYMVVSGDRDLVVVYKKQWEAPYTVEICHLLINSTGKAVTGSDYPDVSLHVPGDIATTHTTPLELNSAVLFHTEPNAHCTRYAWGPGQFDYQKATVSGNDSRSFNGPTYHDAWTGYPRSLDEFERFGTSDDSNGIMQVNDERPHRTLIVKWVLDEPPVYPPNPEEQDPGEGIEISNLRCIPGPGNSPVWRYVFDIENGGETTTQFSISMTAYGDQYRLTRSDQTSKISPGQLKQMHVDIENLRGFNCDPDGEVDVDVSDRKQLVKQQKFRGVLKLGADPPENDRAFHAQASKLFYQTGEEVTVSYFDDNPEDYQLEVITTETTTNKYEVGNTVLRSRTTEPVFEPYTVTLTVRDDDANATVRHLAIEDVLTKPLDTALTIPPNTLPAGEYVATVELEYSSTLLANKPVATQRIIVVPPGGEPQAYVPPVFNGTVDPNVSMFVIGPEMKWEVRMISNMINGFCPTLHNDISYSPSDEKWGQRCTFKNDLPPSVGYDHRGDIYGDVISDLSRLPDRLLYPNGLPRYDVTNTLVIGSNVAHSTFYEKALQEAIEKWVNGGGNLIVFGSTDIDTGWLQEVFYSGQYSSSGGVRTPDASHPLMGTPEQLSIDEYQISEFGWTYPTGGVDHFTDILLDVDTTVTAISDPGDFGDGSIILTTWRPYDILGKGPGASKQEGQKVMFNFLMHGYRDLFLDYGPDLPDGIPIVPAVGVTQVHHPELGRVAMTATIYVFPSDR